MQRNIGVKLGKKRKSVIDVRDVSVRIGGLPILKNLTFSVQKGEYLGIIGPNGGGKTTFLHVLLGLTRPNSGDIRLFGSDVDKFKEWGRIGYVPQRVSIQGGRAFPATVREVVATGRLPRLGLFGRYHAKDNDAIDDAINVVDISNFQNRVVGELSGGERQRVFIARALAGEPEILILDEPTVGVDASSQKTFFSFIRKLNRDKNMTILFVTHDVNVVQAETSAVLCLNHEMVCYDSTEEFMKKEHIHKLYDERGGHVHTHHDHVE